MAANLELIITATDKASGTLKSLDSHGSKLGSTFSTLGKAAAVGAGAGIVALGGFLASSVKEAIEAQKVQAQLDAVLKSTGGAAGVTAKQLQEMAAGFQRTTRFSDEAVLSMQSVLLTFTGIKGKNFEGATEAILNLSTAMGQDLQTSAVQVGKALNDPIAGVGSLRRIGVQLTDSQEELIKSMVAVGDTAGAQRVILKELETQFGGSAKAAGETFAGRLDRLKNALGEVQERVGFALLPILTELAEFMAKNLPPAIEAVEEAAREVGTYFDQHLQPILEDIFSFIKDEALPPLQQFAERFEDFAGKKALIGGALAAVAIGFGAIAIAAGAAAVSVIAATWPILAITAAAAALVTGLIILDEKTGLVTATFNYLTEVAKVLWEWIGPQLTGAATTLKQGWENDLLPILKTVGGYLEEHLGPILEDVLGWLRAHPEAGAIAAGGILLLVAPWAAVLAGMVAVLAMWDKLKIKAFVAINQMVDAINIFVRAWNSIADKEFLGIKLGPHLPEQQGINIGQAVGASGQGMGQNIGQSPINDINQRVAGGVTVNFNSFVPAGPAEMQRAKIFVEQVMRS